MVFEVHSIAGNSFNDACNNLLKRFEPIERKKNVFILIDECCHWFENVEISEYYVSFKGCWIAGVLTGQPIQKAFQWDFLGDAFQMRILRHIYRGTKHITLV